MEREEIGHALRRLRQLRRMTQAQVAERSGCSKSQVSGYERGKSMPRVETLFRLLAAMDWRLLDFGHAVEHVKQHPPAE